MTDSSLLVDLGHSLDEMSTELVRFRRDLHAHPELSRQETRTSTMVGTRLVEAGLRVRPLPGTGLVADVGPDQPSYRVALRADLDALPIRERTGLDWASTVDGVCHACGHDVHTTAVLGAGLALHRHADRLAEAGVGIRLIFQPAEELIPGGAVDVLDAGELDEVDAAYAVHCDPSIDVGQVGLRAGAITAAADSVTVRLSGRGGHTSRPHLTEDLTYALAKVVTDVPAALSRRLDPRVGAALVWGVVQAGRASNVIPSVGEARGTLRMLDATSWTTVGPLLREVVQAVVAPYAVSARLEHAPGVPPVVNSGEAIEVLTRVCEVLGIDAVPTSQSLGGEDFSWYLTRVPGAMARLGTRTPGGRTYDIHQGDLVVDERAIVIGAKLLAAAAAGGVVKGDHGSVAER